MTFEPKDFQTNFARSILDEGLEQSRVLLRCLSPAALASGGVALERSTAVHRDRRLFLPMPLIGKQ